MIVALWIGIFVVSLAVLVLSSDWFVDSAKEIGTFFGWPEFIIGVIIVAIGTSLPELASSMAAVINGKTDIVVSNALGSNITNITLVFGISAFAGKKFTIKHDIMKTDVPFLVFSTAMVILMVLDQKFTRMEAGLCAAAVIIYVVRAITSGEAKEEIEETKQVEAEKKKLGVKPWILLIISPALIALGAHFTVTSVIKVSELLKIGTEVIAVTAIALGTSLPEVMVSIQAARKGNAEMAVGNVIGSNIFNALAVMGIPGLIGVLIIPASIVATIIPLLIVSTALMTLIMIDKRVFRFEGFILLIMYIYFIGQQYGGF